MALTPRTSIIAFTVILQMYWWYFPLKFCIKTTVYSFRERFLVLSVGTFWILGGVTIKMFGVCLTASKCSTQSPGKSSKSPEPMNVGSSSISSLSSSSPQYLPGFLMGDFQASSANGYQVSPIPKLQPHLSSPQHARVVQVRESLSSLRIFNLVPIVRVKATALTWT